MATSRPNLPPDVLVALEDCIKMAEKYGYASGSPAGRYGISEAHEIFPKVQELRRKVVQAIEAHASRMYEGGIEMGLAQARAEET